MAFDEGLADRVRSLLQDRIRRAGHQLLEKRMFGGLVFMVNGNMCCGVRNAELMLRLSNDGAKEVAKRPHARPLDPTGKRIRSLVMISEHGIDLDQDLEEWMEIAYSFVKTLPAKDPSAPLKKKSPGRKAGQHKK
jgi:TfoX/Sxy family transcriptional regulator of competence genes